jgi:hypothetical protein
VGFLLGRISFQKTRPGYPHYTVICSYPLRNNLQKHYFIGYETISLLQTKTIDLYNVTLSLSKVFQNKKTRSLEQGFIKKACLP